MKHWEWRLLKQGEEAYNELISKLDPGYVDSSSIDEQEHRARRRKYGEYSDFYERNPFMLNMEVDILGVATEHADGTVEKELHVVGIRHV